MHALAAPLAISLPSLAPRPNASRPHAHCSAPEHRQFDFWIATERDRTEGQGRRREPHRIDLEGFAIQKTGCASGYRAGA